MTETGFPAIETHSLVKIFEARRVVDRVSLQVSAGTIYGLLGPNGAGKTTIIRMLTTLLRIDGGSAAVFGHDVATDAHAVRQLIGVTGQYASIDETLTARENLNVFCRLLGLTRRAARKRGDELLDQFELADAVNRPLKHFSGGMRRRLDLAVSLISNPPLVFLDEPTTGLDPRTRAQMWETIRGLVTTGSTVLLTTQYLDEADQLADRIAVIDAGQMVAEGTVDELKAAVGRSSLQLTFDADVDTQAALGVVRGIVGSAAEVSSQAHFIAAPLTSAAMATDVLVGLRAHGISVAEMSVQEPSLDDVFLTITGGKQGSES